MDEQNLLVINYLQLLLFIIILGSLFIYQVMVYRNRNYKSAEVAYIMENEFQLSTSLFSEPYYFGSLDDKNFELYKRVEKRLFEEGYDYCFTHNICNKGLIKKSVKEWKRLGYLKEKDKNVLG